MRFGPLAVRLSGAPSLWPWPWPALLRRQPGPDPRWLLPLRCERDASAGEDGPLRWTGASYLGPGFELRPGPSGYEARVAEPVGCMGALAAALVDLGQREPLALMHGALLRVCGRGVLVLGASGSGKSTLAARHAHRVLGSNAALLWSDGQRFHAAALPLTGHGDAAIAPAAVVLRGALVLGAASLRPGVPVLRWLTAAATARGGAPPLGLLVEASKLLPIRSSPVRRGIPTAAPHSP